MERVNGRLKDEFGARQVRVRGHSKVLCHLMFGILALTVDQLLRLRRRRRPDGVSDEIMRQNRSSCSHVPDFLLNAPEFLQEAPLKELAGVSHRY